jgi:hypothetical protein
MTNAHERHPDPEGLGMTDDAYGVAISPSSVTSTIS